MQRNGIAFASLLNKIMFALEIHVNHFLVIIIIIIIIITIVLDWNTEDPNL